MKNVKYTKIIKRVEALFLAVFLVASGLFSQALTIRSYAAEAQAALTAWEVLQLLLMSAGVTIQTAKSASGGTEISDEEYYRAFMAAQADQAWCEAVDSSINAALAKGTASAALTVEFAQETWESLRDWVSGLAQEGRDFLVGSGSGSSDFVYPVSFSSAAELAAFLGVVLMGSPGTTNYNMFNSFISRDNLVVYSCYRDSNPLFLIAACNSVMSCTVDDDGLYIDGSSESIIFNLFFQDRQGYCTYYSSTSCYSSPYVSLTASGRYTDFVPILINSNAASESLGLISDVFYAELKDKVYDVVTPHRVLTDEGAIVGNMTLTIPKALAVPDVIAAVKEGTLPITDVLAQVGVIPVDMTKKKAIADDKTIDEAIEAVESTSDSWSFTADLTEIFPFCLPFDLIRFLDALDADPVAPCFEIPFVVEALGIDMTVEFDMSFMDDAVEIFRIGELGCFIISLILVTQKLIKW